MTIKMTQEEVANWVLDILVNELSLKSGDAVPDHGLKDRYRARNGDSADIELGLEYAEAREWLTYDPTNQTSSLTELGYESFVAPAEPDQK